MTVTVTGAALTLEEVVAVARRDEPVQLDPNARERMRASRGVVERALQRNEPVYGLTTGVAELKRIRVGATGLERFNSDLIRSHRIAQGPPFAGDVVRAAMLRLLNGLASAYPGVRPELAERLVDALNRSPAPTVRSLGSLGQADLAPNADLAAAVFAGISLAPGEALALVDNNAFGSAAAALAVVDLAQLLELLTLAGAMSLEGFAANLSILDRLVTVSRPFPGVRRAVASLTHLLAGSFLWHPGAARNLQDPLTFRTMPQGLGALDDALDYARRQVTLELNASQSNPIVALENDALLSVGNFEILPVAAALDFVRVALSPALTSAAERIGKLVATPWSALPTGLNPDGGAGMGLAELAVAVVAIAGEARSLANPVSTEVVSSSLAEGIEDRITLAPLAARRLSEMVELGRRVAAIEMVVAAQAIELRGNQPLGAGTGKGVRMIREHVPFLASDADFPADLEPVIAGLRSFSLSSPR